MMKLLFPVLLGCAIATGAHAQQASVPKEIVGYRNLTVNFSKSVADCNLDNPTLFANHLEDKLSEIGIKQRDDVYGAVNLGISAQRFGAGMCVTLVEMTFQSALGKANIVTSDERVKQVVDRLGVIPLVLYKDGEFAVQPQTQPSAGGKSTTSQKAALNMITNLVERLKAQR